MNPFKPISISLSPNTEQDDVWLAFKLLFQPWNWKSNRYKKQATSELAERRAKGERKAKLSASADFLYLLEKEFKEYLGVKYAFSFNSGRSALMAILDSLKLQKGVAEADASSPALRSARADEVLLQTFTCNAAVNPIIWARLKPVYVDCDEKTFNIDVEDLKRKITSKSKAVIVQHTFGLAAQIDEILKICQENNLILIEDCAHSLGTQYNNKKVGTFGKVAFLSFSRDKVISSVYGGMAVTNDDMLAQKLKEYQEKIGYPSDFWIFQQLLHPVLMNWLILPTYRILGKYLLVLFQGCRVLSKAVHWKEKRGEKPIYFPKQLPNALAILAQNQLKKLERFNRHRKEIAEFYRQELENTAFKLPENREQIYPVRKPEDHPSNGIYLRLTIKHPQAHEIIKAAWRKNILIGDWYDIVIAPADTKLEKMSYIAGSCPKAEKLAKETLNLPTHINISLEDAQKIVDFLKQCQVVKVRPLPGGSENNDN